MKIEQWSRYRELDSRVVEKDQRMRLADVQELGCREPEKIKEGKW